MLDLIKKGAFFGLGLMSVTKARAEKFVNDLVSKGEMTESEAKDTVDSILKAADKQQQKIETIIENKLNKVLGNFGFATKKDIERLEGKIDKLNK